MWISICWHFLKGGNLGKLEKKFGKYAIPNLMRYITVIYVVGFVIAVFGNDIYSQFLGLDISKVLQGQVWRLVTFILQPPSNSIIFFVFVLYFYYIIGTTLEAIWGSFKFNLYYFSGILFHIIAAFIIYFIFGVSFAFSTAYINLALFLAYAMERGEDKVLLFFIIPVKMKVLGIIDGVFFALTIIGGFLTPILEQSSLGISIWLGLFRLGILSSSVLGCYIQATAALVSMLNFILFFFWVLRPTKYNKVQANYRKTMKTAKKAQEERARQELAKSLSGQDLDQDENRGRLKDFTSKINVGKARHKCAVCGKTELDDSSLEFRYCTKCEGDYEYCMEHLYTHVHVKKN